MPMKRALAAPVARIALRWVAGPALGLAIGDKIAGTAIGDRLASDADVVLVVALMIGAGVEGAYVLARKKGWAT